MVKKEVIELLEIVVKKIYFLLDAEHIHPNQTTEIHLLIVHIYSDK